MSTVADLRDGRSPRVTMVATASTFVPITLVSWATWLALGGDQGYRIDLWILVVVNVTMLAHVTAWVFWRTSTTHAGVTTGSVLAVLTVAAGWWVAFATSGVLET